MSRRDIRAFHRLGLKSLARGNGTKGRFKARATKGKLRRKQMGFARTTGFFGRFGAGRGELKFHDVDLNDAVVAAAGGITNSVNLIAQGTTESTRIGRKATIRSINWRFNMILPISTAAADTADTLRVIMYLDKQCNGATAAITDILESADFQSFNNLANKSRFRTLMDRTYDFVAEAGGGDGTTEDYGQDLQNDSFFKKVNIPIEYDSTAGAITEIRSNNIGVLLITQAGNIAFGSKIRLRFSDN